MPDKVEIAIRSLKGRKLKPALRDLDRPKAKGLRKITSPNSGSPGVNLSKEDQRKLFRQTNRKTTSRR